METKGNLKKNKMSFGKKCLITLLSLLLVAAVAAGFAWTKIEADHREVSSQPLNAVDFKRLKDGVYVGEHPDGMFKWRSNRIKVTVTNGLVSDIELLEEVEFHGEESDIDMLYERVIASQSLQVDSISGATLTSKGLLGAAENALLQAN